MQGKTGPMSSNVKALLKGVAEIANAGVFDDQELAKLQLGRQLLKVMAIAISLEDAKAEAYLLDNISENPLAMDPRRITKICATILPLLTIHLL